MAKKNFWKNINWIEVIYITLAIILIEWLLAAVNLQIGGGFIVSAIVLALKVAVGEGLYELTYAKR